MLLADDPRAALGRKGDKLLAHITPKEAALLKRRGGAGTRNPATGLLEFWDGGDGEGDGSGGEDGSSGRSSDVTPGIAPDVDPSNESGFGPGYSGPGMANPGFFSDPFGWAAYQAQQLANNPVATLANVGLSPLGVPYASQALNGLAEAIGNGIGKGFDALGISQSNGPGTIGPAGSVASAGGPATGQPAAAAASKSGTTAPPAAPAQAAAIRQAQAAQNPAAQVSRMAYGLLGDPRSVPPAAGAQGMMPRVGAADQRRGRVTVDMLPGGPQRQGLLYG
jgi:hypothetical protein